MAHSLPVDHPARDVNRWSSSNGHHRHLPDDAPAPSNPDSPPVDKRVLFGCLFVGAIGVAILLLVVAISAVHVVGHPVLRPSLHS